MDAVVIYAVKMATEKNVHDGFCHRKLPKNVGVTRDAVLKYRTKRTILVPF